MVMILFIVTETFEQFQNVEMHTFMKGCEIVVCATFTIIHSRFPSAVGSLNYRSINGAVIILISDI